MSNVLNTDGHRLLNFLVQHILPNAVVDRPAKIVRNCIGYKAVHEQLHLPRRAEKWGKSLERQGLANMAEWTFAQGLPAISGLIVTEQTGAPSVGGYLPLLARYQSDWLTEIEKSKCLDWTLYL